MYKPRSFFSLVLIGFSLVAVPLMLGLIHAATSVDGLAGQGEQIVHQAVQATRNSLLLFQQLTAMERHAKQYAVLGDRDLLARYTEGHQRFTETTQQLAMLPLDEVQRGQLARLVRGEEDQFQELTGDPGRARDWQHLEAKFSGLVGLSRTLLEESNRLIERELNTLQRAAGRSRKTLLWQALALIPVTLAFAAVFTILILRPIRQIDLAIRRIGDGELQAAVAVRGPRDLEYLGMRLDWLRERLANLEKEKSKFLQHLSHELKTPLSAVREGTDLLAEEPLGRLNAQQREIVHILQGNCARLQRLIENLLNYHLAEARNASLQWETVRLDQMVQSVAECHRLSILKKRIALRLSLAPASVLADEKKLKIAIDNVLSNAVKYAPNGGHIEVSLRPQVERAILDVVDNGPGIAPGDEVRLFEPFFRGRNRPEEPVRGTGLGLAIAREYLAAHDGEIRALPRRQGAHFQVRLPLLIKDQHHAS